MHCPYCGKDHPDETRFCPETGKRLTGIEPVKIVKKNKNKASKKIAIDLSSPITLIVAGILIIVVALLVAAVLKRNQTPTQPATTPDVPATLAAMVNLTASAEFTPPPLPSATATMTNIPPTLTFTVIPPTAYIPPTRTPMAGANKVCPNAYPSVLHKGDVARVSLDPPVENNLRDKPGTDSAITGTLEPGEEVNLVGGPECMGVYVWWSVVSRSSGRAGWTAEGDWNNYWLIKVQ